MSVTCLMTKEPSELETMYTKLRLPSPTSLTDKSSKLLASLEESAGTDFMYSTRVFSSSGRNLEKTMVAADGGEEGVEQWYSLKSQIDGILQVRLTILYLEEAR